MCQSNSLSRASTCGRKSEGATVSPVFAFLGFPAARARGERGEMLAPSAPVFPAFLRLLTPAKASAFLPVFVLHMLQVARKLLRQVESDWELMQLEDPSAAGHRIRLIQACVDA